MTSAEASTKLNNVKIWLQDGTFLCTVPMLEWTSVETVEVRLLGTSLLFRRATAVGAHRTGWTPSSRRGCDAFSYRFSKTGRICPQLLWCITNVKTRGMGVDCMF